MSADQKSSHLARLRELRATRTAKRNAALIGPIVDALECLLSGEEAPLVPPGPALPSDESSDTESVGVPDEAGAAPDEAPAAPLLPTPVGSFNVELAPPPPSESRATTLATREKETRKRLNKQSSRAEVERRCRRIMRESPKGAGRGVVDSDTVQALRSEDPKVFHVNLYV